MLGGDREYGEAMSDQRGRAAGVLSDAQSVLARRDAELAAADARLRATLRDAHAAVDAALRRLDGIDEELDALVAAGDRVGADAPEQAAATRRQLIGKLRDISAVVTDAQAAGEAKAAVLKELSEIYRQSAGLSTD